MAGQVWTYLGRALNRVRALPLILAMIPQVSVSFPWEGLPESSPANPDWKEVLILGPGEAEASGVTFQVWYPGSAPFFSLSVQSVCVALQFRFRSPSWGLTQPSGLWYLLSVGYGFP